MIRGTLSGVRRAVAVGAATILIPGLLVAIGEGPAHAAEVNASSVTMVGAKGDYIGRGIGRLWVAPRGTISASGGANGIFVTVGGTNIGGYGFDGVEEMYLRFAPAPDEQLKVGTYREVVHWPSSQAGKASMDVSGGGRGCSTSTGSFTIHDLAADYSHFWITYEQYCDGRPQPVFGEIRYNMPADSDLLVAPREIDWPGQQLGSEGTWVPVTLVNTGSQPVSVENVSFSGTAAADFSTFTSSPCLSIAPGDYCSFDIGFTPTLPGPRSATLTIQDSTAARTHTVALGSAGITTDDPRVKALAGAPPDAVSGLTTSTAFDAVTLTWQNPQAFDWTQTIVRGVKGTVPPASPDAGFPVYSGTGTTATASDLDLASTYSFAVFAKDLEGLVSAASTATLDGTTITVRANRSKLTYGDVVELRGVLKNARTGAPMDFRDVVIAARDPRTGEVLDAGRATTSLGGEYAIDVQPGVTYEYAAVFVGDESHVGAASANVPRIPVSAAAILKPVTKKGKLGTTFSLIAGADPVSRTQPLVLEEKVGKKWKKVATKKPNKKGIATFRVTPRTTGKHQYRVYRGPTPGVGGGTSKAVSITVT